jgi:hypothetical protein
MHAAGNAPHSWVYEERLLFAHNKRAWQPDLVFPRRVALAELLDLWTLEGRTVIDGGAHGFARSRILQVHGEIEGDVLAAEIR